MLLVTGGAGYVGSHFLLHESTTRKEPLVVLDDLSEGHTEALSRDNIRLVRGSFGDKDVLEKLFSEFEITAVVHFAANAYVGESQEKPFKYFQNNVVNSMSLFEAMENHGVRKLVHSSTCATYGIPERLPIDEDHPQRPVNVYGTTKLMVEQALRSLCDAKNWSVVALRYFNAAGAAADGTIGESHDPETHLIPLVLQAAAGKRDHVDILGSDYDTADGTCVRDYVHVSDLAVAHSQALELVGKQTGMQCINLGTEHGSSVKEVIDTCAAVTGKNIPTRVAPRRPGDPPVLVASAKRAREVLGWKPQYDLRGIVETAWRWECNRKF